MDTSIQEVGPGELSTVIEPGAVTLVLRAPGVGGSRQLRSLGEAVTGLSETDDVDEQELVVVENFVSAVCDLADGSVIDYCDQFGRGSLFTRSGGTVLVARPRGFDWLCRSELSVYGRLIERVDAVLVVRTPPTAAEPAINAVRERVSKRPVGGLGDEKRAALLEQVGYPAYAFETPELQQALGWYDATITPSALLALSKNDEGAALLPADVRRAFGTLHVFGARDTDSERAESTWSIDDGLADGLATLVPSGGLPSRVPSERSPPALAAVSLVVAGLADDAEWLDSLVRYRVVPAAAEALEIALSLPPGTIDHLQVFADDPARTLIREGLADATDDSVVDEARDVIGEAADALGSSAVAFETIATDPAEYGSSVLVGAWHWDGPAALHEAAAERELRAPHTNPDGGMDWPAPVDAAELRDAVDGGLVVLTGPKTTGKRRVAASLAAELEDWGATVRLPELTHPDHVRTGIAATSNAVVIATYGAEPARIGSENGIRALAEWVEAGDCTGAVLICDESNRERLDDIAVQTDCDELATWTDRTEVAFEETSGVSSPDPATVARELLGAIGWGEVQTPSRRTVDVESVTDQSTVAAVSGCPDHALGDEIVGQIVAEVVDVITTTHGPDAAQPWLSFVDDLVADVGRNRTADSDDAIRYRGEVYATAIAAVATANPTTDEWVHAVAQSVLTLTNETAAPPGRESVGGEMEPFATAFAGALSMLAQPSDGSAVNHGAVGCVDQVLHEMVGSEGSQFPLHLVYGRAVGAVVHRVEADGEVEGEVDEEEEERREAIGTGLATILTLVRQQAAGADEWATANVLTNGFGSALGAVAETCPPADLSALIADIESRASNATQLVGDPDTRTATLQELYVGGIGLWVFEHGCSDEAFGPWIEAIGQGLCQTAQAIDDGEPESFVVEAYGRAVRTVVGSGERDRAEQLFSAAHRLVETLARGEFVDDEQAFRAALHAKALAVFGDVALASPDEVTQYPYGSNTIPFDDSLGFEDWIALYDEAVLAGDVTDVIDATNADPTQYLTAVYRDALSTHVQGFDEGTTETESGSPTTTGSTDGVTPRGQRTWYGGLEDVIESRAIESDTDPVAFLADVYGGAAANWAADGASSRTQEWIDVLVGSLRSGRASIDGPAASDWDDAVASTHAEVLAAVVIRTDVGERTHDRLVAAVVDEIETTAVAPATVTAPIEYVGSVFGNALALVADVPPEEIRFGVAEVLTVVDDSLSLDRIGVEREALLERVGSTAGERVRAADGGAHATRLEDGLREAGFDSLADDVADSDGVDGPDVADGDTVGEADTGDGGPDRTPQRSE
ncbi:hypothetical protein Halru_2835 [Halovivax ruber XH-70]|uniref:Uncharacterized protein n=1 Tax=Halovivax ruber (strain DSM 18193 / JCM 13892 / XH-70) TaxID=797302 RepID=L0IGR4_HALRX|nr:hypothetical protein [Halovivax ruber]AGB17406.1 hypothetical protein Halru_2835 [Halovivax ruber XH-70]